MEWMSGIFSGLISGAMTSALFYWLAGKDLKREANALKRETEELRACKTIIVTH